MADRTTHSHDTSTPAVSDETVPSEKFVLVPREPTPEMIKAGYAAYDLAMTRIRMFPEAPIASMPNPMGNALRAAISTLSASHLAKEGGEAGRALLRDLDFHIEDSDNGFSKVPRATLSRLRAALASLPRPSPAAKGGDAVRVVWGIYLNDGRFMDIASDNQQTAIDMAGAHYEEGEYVVRALVPYTPTEGPASQDTAQDTLRRIEAMLDGDQGDDDGMQIMPDYPEGAGLAEKVAACIHLLERRRDIIEASVSPDAEADEEAYAEGCGYTGQHFGNAYDDAVCIDGYLWDLDSCDEPGGGLRSGGEIRCPKCNASPTAEGPASQAEGMGGDVHADDLAVDAFAVVMKEKLARAREKGRSGWNTDRCNSAYLSRLLREHVEKGDPIDVANFCMMLHQRGESITALTPPETAEAVPVAWRWRMAADRVWNYQEDRQRIPDAIHEALYAHPDPEAARLREELERESEESYEIGKRDGYGEAVQHIDQRTGGDGEYCCVVGYDADDRHCPDPQTMIVRIVGRFESLAGQTNSANQERDDAAKALESVTEELGLFRDFVINNATVWTPGSNHHHPIWARVADRLEGYTSPRDGEKWHLVRAAAASDPAPATDEREGLVEAQTFLRDIEWAGRRVKGWASCPDCRAVRMGGVGEHEPSCRIRAALATEAGK